VVEMMKDGGTIEKKEGYEKSKTRDSRPQLLKEFQEAIKP
jgi:hypothetical protein